MRRSASIAVYVGRTVSSPPAGVSSSPRSRAASSDGHDLDPVAVEAAVREPQRQLGRARAGGDEPVEAGEQRLEVDVPDPRDVATVGDGVVQRDHRDARRRAVDERPDRLVRARRVLDQEHQRAAGRRSRSARSGRTPPRSARARRATSSSADPERQRERRCSERVVDVVEAGQPQLDRAPRPPARRV